MKYSVLFVTSAALTLGACSEAPEPTPEATASASTEAAAGPLLPPAYTIGEPPSVEFMVGTWGEGDACGMPIQFQADGTIKDGPFKKWAIEDGQLVMEGAPQKMALKVVDEDTLESQIDASAEVVTLKRC